jgi:hypothetical protein
MPRRYTRRGPKPTIKYLENDVIHSKEKEVNKTAPDIEVEGEEPDLNEQVRSPPKKRRKIQIENENKVKEDNTENGIRFKIVHSSPKKTSPPVKDLIDIHIDISPIKNPKEKPDDSPAEIVIEVEDDEVDDAQERHDVTDQVNGNISASKSKCENCQYHDNKNTELKNHREEVHCAEFYNEVKKEKHIKKHKKTVHWDDQEPSEKRCQVSGEHQQFRKECEQCKYQVNKDPQLKIHKKEGHCDNCYVQVNEKNNLNMHEETVHGAPKLKVIEKWIWTETRVPNVEEVKKIVSYVFAIGVKSVFSKHTYRFRDKIHLQGDKGPIGLQLTCAIARLIMIWFDMLFLEKLAMMGIIIMMYLRYVDDANMVTKALPRNIDYDENEEKLVNIEEEKDVPADQHTMDILKKIANGVIPMIKWEFDCPSKNEDEGLPVLDLKLFKNPDKEDKENKIIHKFYQKDIANKDVVTAKSAMPTNVKLAILTEEGLQRLKNTSKSIQKREQKKVIQELNMKRKIMNSY